MEPEYPTEEWYENFYNKTIVNPYTREVEWIEPVREEAILMPQGHLYVVTVTTSPWNCDSSKVRSVHLAYVRAELQLCRLMHAEREAGKVVSAGWRYEARFHDRDGEKSMDDWTLVDPKGEAYMKVKIHQMEWGDEVVVLPPEVQVKEEEEEG